MKPILHNATLIQAESVVRNPKGAYLFVGPNGTGKVTTATWISKRLHCGMDASCTECHLIDTGANGDFIIITPQDSGSIGIAQVQDLLSRLGKSRLQSKGVRMVIIDGAERLTIEAQNSLLKTIEEPPSKTLIVLAVTDTSGILDTVKSRCELIHFATLPDHTIAEYLHTHMHAPMDRANQIALLSLGSVGTAITLTTEPKLLEEATKILDLIDKVLNATLFERLVMASKLQEGSVDATRFVRLLARHLRQSLRANYSAATVNSITALERFERSLRSNVNGRSAWSRLLLEL